MAHDWFKQFYALIAQTQLSDWLEVLPAQISAWEKQQLHGDYAKWQKLLSKLPQTNVSQTDLKEAVRMGTADDIDEYTKRQITGLLKQFKPWRKGPFYIHDIFIDTEWRSDWKWDRVLPHIDPLAGRTVLDIGCGSGYHMWRMLGEDANFVVGIDPTQLFLMQFQVIKHFNPNPNIHLLPIGVEQLPDLKAFDTVFSMGVLYHRRSPIDFLQQLKQQLRPGGQLVLETLVVEGDEHSVLMAGERYAQMRNVWFLPSTKALTVWLERVGFKHIKVVDVGPTSLDEQRKTEWMDSQSLADFLDPNDHTKTIEGYPAPIRAVLTATV
ncbi:tRNA 5-methoxyuridine(34)/uridine 5-oxyacetic acid(34) synthase CmoB [Aliiglaciecola sp. 2_MG-2023]|uniref:tRNA 5-methoxyuridine(34)/uridine 5-oxyacetic acid(34) synthase CmoB n=1 Tax=unclassified Aliiglaciecola TaxID=2593648 RepID=UPI0026E2FA3C|nr:MULTISPECIES: tRNA 5-methoxyuridine(34)/uridine 5-oxyacetic acid(34) synthase CmoB [unclassified Aliiglaciecola]MDO6712091.1 tRNA 5-methoxyuridine(34)/uridine 5-oxyacetic acid(34) synthase CmoB [Aliiglaciecola sp. 2_MG-2023]MDO6753171.1 tRNA 5-methoxyuridine(34)/uridine 5-oxyacetic acid(34) synthase CmoB [Aliiglaciecola sp. 1_MG-2023]